VMRQSVNVPKFSNDSLGQDEGIKVRLAHGAVKAVHRECERQPSVDKPLASALRPLMIVRSRAKVDFEPYHACSTSSASIWVLIDVASECVTEFRHDPQRHRTED
jgi:hypothetical protein